MTDSYSAESLDANVDTFEDVPDAPRHENDTFDPQAFLATVKELAKKDSEAGH